MNSKHRKPRRTLERLLAAELTAEELSRVTAGAGVETDTNSVGGYDD
jgi:hypothetical protein